MITVDNKRGATEETVRHKESIRAPLPAAHGPSTSNQELSDPISTDSVLRAEDPDRFVKTSSLNVSRVKLIVGSAVFVILTAGIFWYEFHQIQPSDDSPRWGHLRWIYLLPTLLCLPIETLAAALRIRVVCRVLNPGVALWTCIKAELSNVAISMLTPSQTGGGPAQIYILNRDGVKVGTALTISLLSFAGTMVVLFCLGLYSLLISEIDSIGPLFSVAVWTLLSISSLMTFAVIRPDIFRIPLAIVSRISSRIRNNHRTLNDWWPPAEALTAHAVIRVGRPLGRLVDVMDTFRNDVWRFIRFGKANFVWVVLLSLTILFARVSLAYLCLRFLGIGISSVRQIAEAQMALIFLIFFAPTPGGAGFAEVTSAAIMAEIVPFGFAPTYNLLWRFSTLYLPAMAGLLCLARTLVHDAKKTIRNPRGSRPSTIHKTSEPSAPLFPTEIVNSKS